MIDTDSSGTITFDELKDGLKRVGSELMESEIQDLMDAVSIFCGRIILIFRKALNLIQNSLIYFTSLLRSYIIFGIWQADIDNSGTIDYGEFIAATVHLNKLEREENLLSAFSYFDKDASGYITIDEISQACKDFGLDDIHIDEMIKEIDQDNVSYFCCLTILTFHHRNISFNVKILWCAGWTNRLWGICCHDEKG